MIRNAIPATLVAIGLVAAPLGADGDRVHRHRIHVHDDEGTHEIHVEWDEEEFEREMERFAERMEEFGERMGRMGERIGRDVERAMADVDWDEIERDIERHERRHRGHRHEVHIHGDDIADVVESSVEISLAAAFEALRALDGLHIEIDDEAFEDLEREMERLDGRIEQDLDDAMEELEREMELLEEELERSEV